MKHLSYIACLFWLASLVATTASETFEFPPFEDGDCAPPDTTKVGDTTIPQLRYLMANGTLQKQRRAATRLIEAQDEKSLLRVIYALKEGNAEAEVLLAGEANLGVVPLLMEEVAHGSLEKYRSTLEGDIALRGRVRLVATEVCASAIERAEELPAETRSWMGKIASGGWTVDYGELRDKSRLVLEWWLLNAEAIQAGKWDEARLIPDSPLVSDTAHRESDEDGPRPTVPPERANPAGPSWKVSEPFEVWAKRVTNPATRDLSFVDLVWDHGWVEQPPRDLRVNLRPVMNPSFTREPPPVTTTSINSQHTPDASSFAWWKLIVVLIPIFAIVAQYFWKRRQNE
jgi:hypothetical protein